jgi:hypothetical protein
MTYPLYIFHTLETAIADEAQPIEDHLKSQLVGMIQDCQDRVFSTYRAQRSADTRSFNPMPPRTPQEHQEVTFAVEQPSSTSFETDIIETLYERAPLHTSLPSHPEMAVAEVTSKTLGDNVPSDSGYVSEPQFPNSDFSSSGNLVAPEAITADSSQQEASPKTTQRVQETKAESTHHLQPPPQEVSTQQIQGYEFPNMLFTDFNMDRCYGYGTRFDGDHFEKWMPPAGEGTEQTDLWSQWYNFQ